MFEKPPAGWYRDGSGKARWWDGEQWTMPDHLFTEAPASTLDPVSEAAPEPEPVATANEAPTRAHVGTRGKQDKVAKAGKKSRVFYRKKH